MKNFINRLKKSYEWRSKAIAEKITFLIATLNLEVRWSLKKLGFLKQIRHELPNDLVVSFTSYKPRLPYVHNTIKSILCQTMSFDKFVLWLSEEDFANLNDNIKNYEKYGLEILATNDTGSYKKIIPTLDRYKGYFILTVDDDIIYPPYLLKSLTENYSDNKTIICKRAHIIRFDENKTPIKYLDWEIDAKGPIQSKHMLPTGVGGILYPPDIFDARVTDEESFMRLAPRADDLWLYWMARRNGAEYFLVPDGPKLSYVENTQDVGLLHENMTNGNDTKIKNLIKEFGFPY